MFRRRLTLSSPGTVVVASGMSSATFTAAALPLTGVKDTLSATLGGVAVTAQINIASTLSPITCALTVTSGGSGLCTITVSGPAPTGGAAVSISSSNEALSVSGVCTTGVAFGHVDGDRFSGQ